jgi:hypothetical protein
MTKEETLRTALIGREEEVLHYQINIDNYERAIVKAKLDPELADFVVRLEELLSSSRLEQKKATIMRDVIREQLGD